MNAILAIASILWFSVLRRKDVYVLLILLASLLLILVSLNIFGLGSAVGYIKDIGLLLSWLFGWILAIIVSSRELPQEESRGTVFSLLAKPVTRAEIIIGKWLGAWTVVTVCVALFYFLILAVVKAKGGAMELFPLLQALAAHSMVLSILCAIALAFSTRMNHDAAASLSFILSAASFFVVPGVPEYITRETGYRAGLLMFLYNALPHFEVLDFRRRLIHDSGLVPSSTFLLALAYGAALTLLFLLLAWAMYRTRRFVRGKLGE